MVKDVLKSSLSINLSHKVNKKSRVEGGEEKANHNDFSSKSYPPYFQSEPPRNPRPSINMMLKCRILKDPTILRKSGHVEVYFLILKKCPRKFVKFFYHCLNICVQDDKGQQIFGPLDILSIPDLKQLYQKILLLKTRSDKAIRKLVRIISIKIRSLSKLYHILSSWNIEQGKSLKF